VSMNFSDPRANTAPTWYVQAAVIVLLPFSIKPRFRVAHSSRPLA
jgi:hypothetical protein